ncbi:uncharacterized protein RCC_11487 [Ramularia collo-cygni]|uniref:DUF1909-domain-containing protein n=1 Tax=Ramularia collo-cygni TaxID=112498 RepID=A0A2D3VCA3_9PEZI|nr:uncharacterized protein RCC_11487 [Ramularia collo-cygni]CZT25818.1 uncharacterized protein RCC_11487 [Ramularia collo-cygni]
MGNGAKAQQKRERAADKTKKGPTSQLKSNAAAKSVKCKVCFQDFQSTVNRTALDQHAESRHSKKYEDCFAA